MAAGYAAALIAVLAAVVASYPDVTVPSAPGRSSFHGAHIPDQDLRRIHGLKVQSKDEIAKHHKAAVAKAAKNVTKAKLQTASVHGDGVWKEAKSAGGDPGAAKIKENSKKMEKERRDKLR